MACLQRVLAFVAALAIISLAYSVPEAGAAAGAAAGASSTAGAEAGGALCAAAFAPPGGALPGGAPLGGSPSGAGDLNEILALFRGMNASIHSELASVKAEVAAVNVKLAEIESSMVTVNVKLAEIESLMVTVNVQLAEIDLSMVTVNVKLAEIDSSMVTVSAAARVDKCARAAVWHFASSRMMTSHANGTTSTIKGICSAFAFAPARGGGSTAVVTAAHCVSGLPSGASVTLDGVGGLLSLVCTVAAVFPAPDDAAILDCPGSASVAGLALAPAGVLNRLRAPVGIAGFAADAYSIPSANHLPGRAIALNIDFAHIAGVVGPNIDGTGAVCVTSDVLDDGSASAGVQPLGFVDRRLTPGTSGGPVTDLDCGVVGIAHGRSCSAGAFVSLQRVTDFLANKSSA